MPARLTSTALAQGYKNALICAAGLLVVFLSFAWAIAKFAHRPFWESFWLGWAGLMVVIFLAFFVGWVRGLRSGGRVLLDCGPHPAKKLFLLNGIAFLLMGLTGSLGALFPDPKLARIAGPAFGVSFIIYWAVMATGRLQIREQGLWQYWGLLKWANSESYRWSKDSTLLIRAKGTFGFLLRGALPVPPENQADADQILRKHCPSAEALDLA